MMNFLVYHIASGQSFFTGVALVIFAAIASTRSKPIAKRLAVFAFLLGAIAIAISSTAIPYWYYAVAVGVTVAWAVAGWLNKWRRSTSFALIAAWAVAALVEAPYHIAPTLKSAPSQTVTVIGDSITAGLGDGDKSERWPQVLAREHDLEVQDISHAGETAASALDRAKNSGIRSSVVVLEIGGNDLLGSTSSAQFARDLDSLLAYVCTPQRQVLMFELPLPPFNHEYGRIQRTLARQYNVSLVPKRILLSVLATGDSTVDTIHLTQAGQRRMAASVWPLLSDAFPQSQTAASR
jgi:acyl-CoA thioesterase I